VCDIVIANAVFAMNCIVFRFLRELTALQRSADYSSCDETNLAMWLNDVSPDVRRYTYAMLNAGINTTMLPELKESHLMDDCRITNTVHRLLILKAAKTYSKGTCTHRTGRAGLVLAGQARPSSPRLAPARPGSSRLVWLAPAYHGQR